MKGESVIRVLWFNCRNGITKSVKVSDQRQFSSPLQENVNRNGIEASVNYSNLQNSTANNWEKVAKMNNNYVKTIK